MSLAAVVLGKRRHSLLRRNSLNCHLGLPMTEPKLQLRFHMPGSGLAVAPAILGVSDAAELLAISPHLVIVALPTSSSLLYSGILIYTLSVVSIPRYFYYSLRKPVTGPVQHLYTAFLPTFISHSLTPWPSQPSSC